MITSIVFAAGCFWGVEKHFEHLDGVISAESGYAGGNYAAPDYERVLKYRHTKDGKIINYTESVKVTFDNDRVSAKALIRSFWELHDPTQKNGQGNDIGNNYRSAIFYTNSRQKEAALETKTTYQYLLSEHGYGKITTQISPLKHFYPAESYHQDYLQKHPFGYCPNHSTGVTFSKTDQDKGSVVMPLGGKEIVVIKSPNYCPYCEKFQKDVTDTYHGTIPIRTVVASRLKGFKITTDLSATPTILFVENGVEKNSVIGYIPPQSFYKKLGDFKLGKQSQSYRVAFAEGTDGRFCKQYDLFKHTPDGVFIDKLSGDILFDTRDRFNSATGWLSFYKAKEGSVIEREDNSFGMKRIEIIAKKSGIHLGHVFPWKEGKRRFCINATVLEFVPRSKSLEAPSQ